MSNTSVPSWPLAIRTRLRLWLHEAGQQFCHYGGADGRGGYVAQETLSWQGL